MQQEIENWVFAESVTGGREIVLVIKKSLQAVTKTCRSTKFSFTKSGFDERVQLIAVTLQHELQKPWWVYRTKYCKWKKWFCSHFRRFCVKISGTPKSVKHIVNTATSGPSQVVLITDSGTHCVALTVAIEIKRSLLASSPVQFGKPPFRLEPVTSSQTKPVSSPQVYGLRGAEENSNRWSHRTEQWMTVGLLRQTNAPRVGGWNCSQPRNHQDLVYGRTKTNYLLCIVILKDIQQHC